jgi:P4 family phage/plasmid primase-like protien
MEASIETILRRNYVDTAYHTHVSLISPEGKYQFNRQTLEEFWRLYCDDVKKGKYNYGIAEKPQQYAPVLVDVDLKIDVEKNMEADKLYTYDNIEEIVRIYQKVIREIVEDWDDNNLVCILLEKEPYQMSTETCTYIKNGFHMHFPNLFLDRVEQEIHLIPRVKDLVKATEMFKHLGFADSGDVIDKACCTVPWLLYGSKKSIQSKPYTISKVYDHNVDEMDFEEAFKHYLIYDQKERAMNIRQDTLYYLPRILSIVPYGRDSKELRIGLPIPSKHQIERKKEQKAYNKLTVTQNLNLAERLLPMLGDFRAENYLEWMTVGWVLYNMSEGCEEGLGMWLKFSKRCGEKYDETRCVYEWDRMVKTDMSLGTLRYYASIDSPEQYKEFKKEQTDRHIQESLGGAHNDVAKILHSEYGNDFVCASISKKIWYQFNGDFWEEVEEGIFLREKISSEIVAKYKEQIVKLFSNKGSEDDNANSEKGKKLMKVIKDLKSAPFKDNVMREAREVFYDKRFREKLNINPNLIAFKNGVYDLANNIFRRGRPEDFVSKCIPISYKIFSDDDKKVQDVREIFVKIFADKSINTYFWDTASEIFQGGNFRKIVQFWTGEGDNGKSITQMFFEKMLGQFSVILPTTLFTSKKNSSGGALAELARCGDGVRAAFMDELDEDEAINCGIFKRVSGNDSYYARDLFEKGKETKEIKPLFKVFCICNKLPRFLKGGDKATWNRVRVLPFESTFCKEDNPAPNTYEEQLQQKRFPIDRNLEHKIPDLVEAFAWLLLEHRKKPKIMIDPEKVSSATLKYRQRNDVYRQFIGECIVQDPKSKLSLIELYSYLKVWYKESLPGYHLPTKDEITDYFVKIWGDMEAGRKWIGYKICTLEDQVKAGDVLIIGEDDLVQYDEDGADGAPPI